MSHMHEEAVWSSGNLRERNREVRKTLTVARKFMKPLFPKIVQKDEEEETGVLGDEESEESDSSASSSTDSHKPRTFTVDALRDKARSLMKRALEKCGYSEALLDNNEFVSTFAKALSQDAEIISRRTGRSWIERAIPEEPPAFVRPGSLRIGDRVQVLNWVPLGVHGAVIDIYPKGNVSKIYSLKCLVTKSPLPPGYMVPEGSDFEEEERIIGIELDGKGPYPVKEVDMTPFPYVTKDNTVILRFPPLALPSGRTEHYDPMIM